MSLITCNNLSIGYEGHEIHHNINFQVNPGDYLCIVGENGAGKSTLMKTILGLIPPVKGSIVYEDGLAKNQIGYLPQQTLVQRDFPASVEEIVVSGFQGKIGLRPFYTKEEKQTALKNIDRMHIADLTKKCYRELSGGQQQRVLLARALCATEKILLLDEPVAALDPIVTAEMYELIKSLNQDGVTIIMISHDINAALQYASHILHVGNNLFYGTTKEYTTSELGKHFVMLNNVEVIK